MAYLNSFLKRLFYPGNFMPHQRKLTVCVILVNHYEKSGSLNRKGRAKVRKEFLCVALRNLCVLFIRGFQVDWGCHPQTTRNSGFSRIFLKVCKNFAPVAPSITR